MEASSTHRLKGDIEAAVVAELGRERVRSIESEFGENDDGLPIARVTVVYSAKHGLSVVDMGRVLDALWPGRLSEEAPIPVVDFQEDTDTEPVAAE